MLRLLSSMVRANLLVKLWRWRKEIRANFADASQTTKVTATVSDKCIVKVKKAWNLWVESRNRKHALTGRSVLRQKARRPCEGFSEGVGAQNKHSAPRAGRPLWFQASTGVSHCVPLGGGALQYSGISHPMGSIVFVNYI